MKKTIFFLPFMFIACSYHKDKLVIINNSKKNISYEIFIKTKNTVKDDCVYKVACAPEEFKFFNESSPLVRNFISDEIDEF
jgi:hypothetical protein